MAIGAVRATGGIDKALATSYRRFTADAPRDERATLSSNHFVRPVGEMREKAAPQNSPAALLSALIDRMGGAADSHSKGSYVNLRI